MNVDDLTIHGLGFSGDRPLKKRKFDLTACIAELLEHGIIELGKSHSGPQDLFIKRGKGLYVVQFFEGPYFRQPEAGRSPAGHRQPTDDPLYEPLNSIGVDAAGIRRLFKQYSREAIQRWIRITDAAMHEKPQSFPGFRTSPAAFLIDGIQNSRMPPDWIYAHEKEAKRRRWEAERSAGTDVERPLRDAYEAERAAALQAFLQSPEGREHCTRYEQVLLELYWRREPERCHQAAHAAAVAKVEREHFPFPDFSVWLLSRRESPRLINALWPVSDRATRLITHLLPPWCLPDLFCRGYWWLPDLFSSHYWWLPDLFCEPHAWQRLPQAKKRRSMDC